MPASPFTVRHARSIHGLLGEVNSEPPARIAIGGALLPASDLASAVGRDAPDAVAVQSRPAPPDELGEFEAFIVVIDEWPLTDGVHEQLRAADRAALPIVAVLIGLEDEPRSDEIPYVLATDVVRADRVADAAVPAVERVAARAKGEAYRIAHALPHFREEAAKATINHYARLNGLVSVASMVPLADLPVLTLNQLRMVARLAGAYGIQLDAKRLIELTAVVGAGLGFRRIARTALAALPGPRWAMKGGVALGGTVAIGEAAMRRFRAEVESGAPPADNAVDAP